MSRRVELAKPTRLRNFLRFLLALFGLVFAVTAFLASPAAAQTIEQPPELAELSDGLAYFALAACIAGICVSAALWAMGSKGQNPGTELAGKKGMILCCTAALLVGALPGWINALSEMAGDADTSGIMDASRSAGPVPTVQPNPDATRATDTEVQARSQYEAAEETTSTVGEGAQQSCPLGYVIERQSSPGGSVSWNICRKKPLNEYIADMPEAPANAADPDRSRGTG